MNIPAIFFGVFGIFVLAVSVFFIIGAAQSQPLYTDTYGNAMSASTNNTAGVVGNVTSAGGSTMLPLVLIAGAIAIIAVVVLIYLYFKWRY